MKILKNIYDWFVKLQNHHNQAQAFKRRLQLDKQSCMEINVVEFNKQLYIAYNGIPLVRVEDIKIDVTDLLDQSRLDYLRWKERFNK